MQKSSNVRVALLKLEYEFTRMKDISPESTHAYISAVTTLKLLFEKKLNSSNTINTSGSTMSQPPYTINIVAQQPVQQQSEIDKHRITAAKANELLINHSVLVAIYKKINRKVDAGLKGFVWKHTPLTPEVKYLLETDGYKIVAQQNGTVTITW